MVYYTVHVHAQEIVKIALRDLKNDRLKHTCAHIQFVSSFQISHIEFRSREIFARCEREKYLKEVIIIFQQLQALMNQITDPYCTRIRVSQACVATRIA